jgi:class 3 adenylate cyclase
VLIVFWLNFDVIVAVLDLPSLRAHSLITVIAAHGAAVPAPVVAATSVPVLAPIPAPVQTDAERRQLTVMFCDLVGSTALSMRFDPEDLREQIGDYDRAVSETVDDFDGFVAKYIGDGMLVYFG